MASQRATRSSSPTKATFPAAARGRNTEVFTFADEDKIARTEVYFGWNLE
jgi:hypothetical protein